MSGGKGTQQIGSSTASTESRAGSAQFPYYQGGLQRAGEIYGNESLYPNYAPATPEQIQGYQDLYNTGQGTVGQGLQPPAYDAYGALIRGVSGPQQTSDRVVGNAVNAAYNYANPITGYADQAVDSGKQYSGQIGGYADQAAASGNQYGSQIAGYANQAGANNNAGLNQLMRTATESPATNPYLQDMVNAALRPVSEQYATSTAPTLDARFSAGGRYGSGAADVAAGSARDAFARNLGEISTGMYGKEYEFNRNLQQQAADLYSQRYNAGLGLGMQGLASASDQARQGLGLGIQGLTAADAAMRQAYGLGITGQTAAGGLVDQGERTALSAADLNQRGGVAGLQMYPQFAQSMFLPARSAIDAGTGLQTLQQQAYNAPFDRLRQYMATIGAPGGGVSETKPIFGNPLTSALSGATGVLGLGKELGLGSGLNSLFGGGADAALGGTFGGGGTVGAGFGSIGEALAAGLPEAGFGLSEALPIAATAAATIVCTELVRQGRMPNTWRLAGMRQFMRYPAIARRGYWVWATPVVAHLRQKPDSRFSKVIERTFNWRAEDLAARNGVKGARRLIRGRLVTAAMVLPCLLCGLMTTRDYFPSGKDAPA